jgi:hypothetical protein
MRKHDHLAALGRQKTNDAKAFLSPVTIEARHGIVEYNHFVGQRWVGLQSRDEKRKCKRSLVAIA